MNARSDVIVLGAGVVGVATAYALARRGLSVTLLDRAAQPAMGASFANGAQLSYAYADALGGPALARRLPQLLLGADPLFKVRVRPDPDMLLWALRFLRECTAERQAANTAATLALALESQRAMAALLERHPLDFARAVAGKMHLYYDPAALAAAEPAAALKRAAGVEQHVLGAAEARAIEPALGESRALAGVVFSPGDEVGDPHLFSVALAGLLERQYGVAARYGFDVRGVRIQASGVRVEGGAGEVVRGRLLVVAAGPGAPQVLKALRIAAPVLPMKGYSFNAPPGALAPKLSLTDTARRLVFCDLGGTIRVAGGAELGVSTPTADARRVQKLAARAAEALPNAADFAQRSAGWAGLRPMTPWSAPVIARPRPEVIVNIGHGMLGWTLAMGSAERAAALAVQTQ